MSRGQRRYGCAGRHVGQALDGQCGPLDRIAPAVVGHPGAAEPVPPVASGCFEPAGGVGHVRHRDQLVRPGQRAVDLVTGIQHVPAPDPVALDAELEVGLQPHGQLAARGGGDVAAAVGQRPLRRDAAVVERGLADELDLDSALQTPNRAHEHVVGVLVGWRPGVRGDLVLVLPRTHCERVPDHYPASRRLPGRLQDVGPRLIHPRRRVVDAEGSEPEVTGLPVEQAAEDAR